MTELYFIGYKDFKNGKLCRVETLRLRIPINIEAKEGSDFSLRENDRCEVEISGRDSELRIYPSKAAFMDGEAGVTPYATMPIGTMGETPDGRQVEETPFLVFSGEIMDVRHNEHPGENDPDYYVTIKASDFVFDLPVFYKDTIEKGYWIMGITWLTGVVKKPQAAL
ncbi:MAG: hypothetical protein LKK20_01915 [Acidaminococcus sp.]|nr:hypothetical protein [Acidaminococcus sp.]